MKKKLGSPKLKKSLPEWWNEPWQFNGRPVELNVSLETGDSVSSGSGQPAKTWVRRRSSGTQIALSLIPLRRRLERWFFSVGEGLDTPRLLWALQTKLSRLWRRITFADGRQNARFQKITNSLRATSSKDWDSVQEIRKMRKRWRYPSGGISPNGIETYTEKRIKEFLKADKV